MTVYLIKEFAPDLANKVKGWLEALLAKLKHDFSYTSVEDDSKRFGKFSIPLVVCESRQDLKKVGVLCPYEFIIERHHLVPIVGTKGDSNGELLTHPQDQLVERLKSLAIKYPRGISGHSLRDWFAGLFRRYMFLDETVHGTSNLIDLNNLDNSTILEQVCMQPIPDDAESAQKLYMRFTGIGETRDSLLNYKALLSQFFKNEIDEMCKVLTAKNSKGLKKIYERCADSYSGKSPYPRPLGDRAKYVTPTDKIDVLLIDDKPEEIDSRIDLGLFNIQKLRVNKADKDVFETVRDAFVSMRQKGLSFNLVLVDLCLGDASGGDLTGYRMIKYVRKHLPGLPIVVYSRYSDMDHIARAFLCGARWFLVKGTESKLPRHVLRMLKQSGWHREWESVKHSVRFLSDDERSIFMRRFRQKDEWQYLTYKGLEYFPGHFITIDKMGDGISTAVTFKAIKGVKLDGEYLQSPSIIKIDSAFNTAMEFERYFRMIRPYISNEAGRVEMPERVLNRDNASIVYTFAGRQNPAHSLNSMGALIRSLIACESSCDYRRLRFAFDMVFDEILPQIHRVTPNREFGEGDVYDLHLGAVDSPNSKDSAFPNILFNEFSAEDFHKGYLCRMQPWECIELPVNARFMSQPQYDECLKELNASKGTANPNNDDWFTFHGIFRVDDSYVIEAFDSAQHLVWIKGWQADHAARYRRLISPGKTLWVSGIKSRKFNDYRPAWFGDAFKLWEAGESKVRDFLNDIWYCAGINVLQGASCDNDIEMANSDIIGKIIALEDDLIAMAKAVGSVLGKTNRIWGCEFNSPIAIVHGDLNSGNVMLESRRQNPPPEHPDERWRVSDVWFIDFARTRRDVIAHDFNVAFTATLTFLFEQELLNDANYKNLLHEKFAGLVMSSFTSCSKNLDDYPDGLKGSPRLIMIYQILRRIRFAALKAGVSPHMYLLTSALSCAYTIKIFLNKKKYELAAGLVVTMKICHDLLRKDILDEDFKKDLTKFEWGTP